MPTGKGWFSCGKHMARAPSSSRASSFIENLPCRSPLFVLSQIAGTPTCPCQGGGGGGGEIETVIFGRSLHELGKAGKP